MRKYTFLLIATLFFCFSLSAAPGDTTWVQANSTIMDGGGNYDTTITFPIPAAGVTYRNIYMIFTLGKHMCPGYTYSTGSVPWCGDWDYTVKNKLMTPGGDTLELGRFITPYANASAPRTPYTWTQRYIYDVTEYASKMQGSNTMRISFDAGSGGWTGNIKFMFIEGVPDRNVIAVKKLYSGSFGYGGTPDINVNFPVDTETAPEGTKTTALKVTVTGHGGNGVTCCEFQSHNYQVMLNGSSIATKAVWRNTCGANELYLQSGTWLYNRANWCPGAMVNSDIYTLPGITDGSVYNVGVQFDPYTGSGYYIVEGTLLNYGPLNKTLDAGIDGIIAPNNDENYFRENPALLPRILVKNRGTDTITSLTLKYGLKDSVQYTYNWTGSIASLQETEIDLPQVFQLNEVTGTTGTYAFVATITSVNGGPDADATNNTMTSSFLAAPRWPSQFKVLFRTNNETISASSPFSETSWIVYDKYGTIVAQRANADTNSVYTDTVNLVPGLYKFAIYDSSCDGLQNFIFPNEGITSGSLSVKNMSNGYIYMNGYSYSGFFNNDFGCGYTQFFYVGTPVDQTGIKNVMQTAVAMDVFPNPARNTVNVDILGLQKVDGSLQIIDQLGRTALEIKATSNNQQVDVSNLVGGVYSIIFTDQVNGTRLTQKLVIAK